MEEAEQQVALAEAASEELVDQEQANQETQQRIPQAAEDHEEAASQHRLAPAAQE